MTGLGARVRAETAQETERNFNTFKTGYRRSEPLVWGVETVHVAGKNTAHRPVGSASCPHQLIRKDHEED